MFSVSNLCTEILRNRSKSYTAAHIHAECSNLANDNGCPPSLSKLLDELLNPSKDIGDRETINWCKWLIASGHTPEKFAKTVRMYDNATTCGLVWTPNFVAYRCRTCGISPCMSLCTECFKKGNHYGHDFNMFLSQAGGACDCGDSSVMKESGFCDRHGPKAAVDKSAAPSNLMCVAEAMMPRIILRLIQHLRENCTVGRRNYEAAIQDADEYLTMLIDFNKMGALMRHVMTSALTNPQKYRSLMDPTVSTGEPEYDSYCQDSNEIYQNAVRSLPNPEPPDEYKECASLQEHLQHTTFLEELMFWTVAYQFPQKLVCLLLNMLPDPEYKEALTRAFVLHYSRVSMMLERSTDPDTLSNKVVHVSVQLFSNESLALKMVDQLKLLHVMVIALKYMMSKILIQNTLHDPDKNFHYVVDCERQVMKEHCYWPIVSDLNNVLSHKPIAVRFMSDDTLLEMWFDFLSMFQGMNVNQRELNQHVEYESNTYYAAFSAELEASAYPMWALVSHLRGPESAALTRRVLSFCLTALQDWLDAINFTHPNVSDSLQVSFHLPLHRYFAVFMCQAVRQQGATLNDLLPPTDMLHLLMMHPLRVQVAFYEILNGLWVRNGLQIKGQIMTYIQCNFCNSMVDADLYLLQVCATKLQPDVFLKTIVKKFHIKQEMSLCLYRTQNEYMDGEHDTPMLESFLTFLAILVNVRTNLGLSDPEMSRLEMVTLLSMGDKTHSQLMELMPERSGSTQNRDFESVLSDVAVYRAPNLEASGNMQQGMYGPKPRLVWEELFDPLHVLLRAAQKGDFQMAMDRFTEYVKQSGKLKNSAIPWPPFRHPAPVSPAYDDPRIVLRSRVFHAMILIILYKAVYGHNISEHVMALTIYLLEMAVITAEIPDKSMNPLCQYSSSDESSRIIKDMDLGGWYKSDDLSENLRTVIPQVILIQESEPSNSDSDFEWEIQGEMAEVGTSLMINDATDEGSLEVLALPSLDTITNDTGLQIAVNASLPALPQPNDQFQITFVPEDGIVTISEANSEDDLIPLQRALPSTTEESMALAIESPPLLNNIGGQPALPPTPQRPAVMAGNEIVAAPTVYSRLSNSRVTTTEIVPSTSSSYKHFKRRDAQGGSLQSQTVKVNESIITLLLKLHSQLSGIPDSYNPEQIAMSDNEASSSSTIEPTESRIGDGPFFIAQILNKITNLDPMCKDAINEARNKLWPSMQESEDKQREKEDREREERRRRAKERQQKLMAEFANKRKQFMEKAMETDEAGVSGMDWDQKDNATKLTSKKEYDCVICSQSSPSTEDNPMGLVVLVQGTSVIGHERQQPDRLLLPTSDDDPLIPKCDTRGAYFDRRMDAMDRHFDTISLLLSVNLGWEGGVYVQTCGHHLHLDCLLPYVKSLGHQQRQLSLAVDSGEYLCPLCRQLANCFLPLSPQLGKRGTIVRSPYVPFTTLLPEINNLLKEVQRNPSTRRTFLSEAMRKAVQDMTRCTNSKCQQQHSYKSLFVFITSIARTNFEIELVQRGGSLCIPPPTTIPLRPKRDCIVALLDVLAKNARLCMIWPVQHTWQQLSGLPPEPATPLALTLHEGEVPLLLRDPTALLIQFILLLPLHADQAYFSSVVKVIYNLLYYQVIIQISGRLTQAERNTFLGDTFLRECIERGPISSETIFCKIIEYFNNSPLYHSDIYDPSTSSCTPYARDKMHSIEQQIQFMCLPFLRVAALLRYHLYEEPLPIIRSPQTEFARLVRYLELVTENMDWNMFNSAVALNWQDSETSISVPRMWCDQFLAFVNQSDVGRYLIMEQHVSWQVPKLLSLPREYEKIFTYYHGRQCRQGHSIPQEISICLLCGAIVCLKQNRKQWNVCEVVQHSIDCGGGTGIYLVVTSTYIVVIRGQRVCLWGSLYLDDFEEEDRDLKRGKPLYLNQDRYQLLEQQWLAHRFDHTKKTWVWHRDIL
ncbi:E3 ubiquitin-protein ligase Ubr3 isoform X1 [Bombus bifarius]|uniref:E3 ubiquitin-protein ligase n=1 Tax=Bombus bifarius TaxID=103933 RepID=A0A6P8M5E2_9HYME|nr:E3 ubiquitin-protein ligase Ubr3 isoform X1 [Bombus bifarius]XP_033303153.1 E3 ubiquitin-protein ligase Ubr3 isoform X1 [Bombus bifarius]XP_033303154.1 E3 ubiquitin-protein ligase Ubr3 isoform X1 [Bombus bifarius]XP_033303155.1 E3 ubiquitin-protein ligase Ubr3 isoform X1 [Bombus bifarius]XP_033303156.1 E3 ubiquitin-protein ligase Ubr3 isoform X1 [Bombus bifarius]XP_033303157.1 E3 ubiquitin-protein ligase Ubr3 isoform X1 [Bombus bifarius]XP_033303158.1 E3 ubiquitin-protein ligase Ubr3 isofo